MKKYKEFMTEKVANLQPTSYSMPKMDKGGLVPFKNKAIRFVDSTNNRLNPHTKKPSYVGKHVGSVNWKAAKGVGADLWEVLPSDVGNVSLKKNEAIFRYTTYTTQVGDMAPLIKINLEKGLIYFLTDKAKEEDKIQFESKGTSVDYLTIIDDYLPTEK